MSRYRAPGGSSLGGVRSGSGHMYDHIAKARSRGAVPAPLSKKARIARIREAAHEEAKGDAAFRRHRARRRW